MEEYLIQLQLDHSRRLRHLEGDFMEIIEDTQQRMRQQEYTKK
jgi:hypothetical protein